jgi:hypothetical protein
VCEAIVTPTEGTYVGGYDAVRSASRAAFDPTARDCWLGVSSRSLFRFGGREARRRRGSAGLPGREPGENVDSAKAVDGSSRDVLPRA